MIFDHSQVNISYILNNYKIILDYLNQDVLLLKEIIELGHKRIYKEFNIDIFKRLTIASLAFSIYRAEYLLKLEPNLISSA
jgi:hypothetical protein